MSEELARRPRPAAGGPPGRGHSGGGLRGAAGKEKRGLFSEHFSTFFSMTKATQKGEGQGVIHFYRQTLQLITRKLLSPPFKADAIIAKNDVRGAGASPQARRRRPLPGGAPPEEASAARPNKNNNLF